LAGLEGTRAGLRVSESIQGRLTVYLSGEYDIAAITPLEADIEALLGREADVVVVDMSDLTFMDTSGVAVLLRIANHFGPIEIRNPSSLVCRSIQALGLSERLRMPTG
jgi:anti-anti-sigma factor